MALKFKAAELKSLSSLAVPLAEDEVETINLGEVLPRGSVDDLRPAASSPGQSRTALTPEQRAQQMQLAALKLSFEKFKVGGRLSRIDITDIKRGDVVAINTIVGSIYLRVVDRIKAKGAGEALCECHYDLGEQSIPAHAASIQLPICARHHTIVNPDGSKRLASRKLKMSTDAVLPAHVGNLLHEQFFVEIAVYLNPQPERLRLIDFGRWIARFFLWIAALIEANNRIEREKKEKKEAEKRRKQEEKRRKKEEKLAAREAKINNQSR